MQVFTVCLTRLNKWNVELLFIKKHTSVWKYKSKKYYCWHSFTVVTHLPRLAICSENLPWLFAADICRSYLPWLFAVVMCREYLSQPFAVGIRRRYLPWEFAVTFCRGIFVYVSKSFFVYVGKSCLYGSKCFLDVSETFLFVRFSLLMMFLFVIVVALMGHCR